MKGNRGLLAGSGAMLVLALLEGEDMYGYQIVLELGRRSSDVFQMQEGTLYPILHGLEKDRCLESYRQAAPSGRERKYYHLTRKGRETLEQKRGEWETFRTGVEQVLQGGASALAPS